MTKSRSATIGFQLAFQIASIVAAKRACDPESSPANWMRVNTRNCKASPFAVGRPVFQCDFGSVHLMYILPSPPLAIVLYDFWEIIWACSTGLLSRLSKQITRPKDMYSTRLYAICIIARNRCNSINMQGMYMSSSELKKEKKTGAVQETEYEYKEENKNNSYHFAKTTNHQSILYHILWRYIASNNIVGAQKCVLVV